MTTIRDVQIARQEQEARLEPVREFTIAILIFVDSPDLDAKAAGFDDHVWASELNQPESAFRILNRKVAPVVGTPVKIGYPEKPPFERQVLGVYDNIHTWTGYDPNDGGALNSNPHAQAHQFPSEADPGVDRVLIYQPALQPLKTTGDATTLTILVQALNSYRYNDTHKSFGGTTLDLTSSVPSVANTVRNVLVYLDAVTNTILAVDGTAVPVGAFTIPKPALPENGIASAYVQLTNAQTSITTASHVTDAREFLEPRILDILLTPTAAGQIIISHDGLTFEKGVPYVDANGDIITDINGHIVTT